MQQTSSSDAGNGLPESSSSGSDKGNGKNQPPNNNWKALLENEMLQIVGIVAALGVATYYVWQFVQNSLSINHLRAWGNKCFSTTFKGTLPQNSISRPALIKSLAKKLETSIADGAFNPTWLVTGPRGSGKTTLINMLLKDKWNVIAVTINTWDAFTERSFASSINESLTNHNITEQGPWFLQSVLRMAKDPPILVVEVNERCSSEQLQSLLLVLKNWGADLRLIRPLVILSTSKAAFGLHIGLMQLRTVPFLVDDVTEAEAELLLKDICRRHTHGCTEEDLSCFCKKLVSAVGTRPLHFSFFSIKLRAMPALLSYEELNEAGNFLVDLSGQYAKSLKLVMDKVCGTDKKMQATFKRLFETMKKRPVPLYQLLLTLDIKEKQFLNLVADLEVMPQPFYIQLCTENVYLESKLEKTIPVTELENIVEVDLVVH